MIIILARIRSRLHYIIPKCPGTYLYTAKKPSKTGFWWCASIPTLAQWQPFAKQIMFSKQNKMILPWERAVASQTGSFGLLWIHEVRLSCDRLAAYRHASASNFCFSLLRDANKSSINAVKQNQVPQSIIICASIPLGCWNWYVADMKNDVLDVWEGNKEKETHNVLDAGEEKPQEETISVRNILLKKKKKNDDDNNNNNKKFSS